MMKSAKTKIFILCQTAVYAAFMLMDVLGVGSSAPVKFAGMVLCCAFSAIFSADGGERTVTAAVLLSSIADVLLLLLDARYAVGVLLFCAVQLLYFVRIFRANGHKAAPAARILLFAAAAALLWTLGIATAVNVLACAYFTFFLCNTVQSFKIKNRLFSVGLCLFLCCDICVGIHNLPFAVPLALGEAAALGMWAFYLPSQVLIVISGRRRDEKAS